MSQPDLFQHVPTFDGPGLEPADQIRLSGHLEHVKALMADGRARTLAQIAAVVGCSEASASARLRDLRKSKFGAYRVDRTRVHGGLHTYRLITEAK